MPSLDSTAELLIQNACGGAPEPALPAGSWMQPSLLLLGPHFENRSPGSPSRLTSSPERQEPKQRRGYAGLPTPGESSFLIQVWSDPGRGSRSRRLGVEGAVGSPSDKRS